jgi:UDP-3-O-[3-hydroxymyristoyl] glucosamine N-acyltransferase
MKTKRIDISQIIDFLDKEVIRVDGPVCNVFIDNIPDPANVSSTSLDWVNSNKSNKQEIAESSSAKVLVVDSSIEYSDIISSKGKTLIVVKYPRISMSRIATKFFIDPFPIGIHPSAIVDKEAVIDSTAYIGPGCVVGKATIGANTVLIANVTVYNDVKIGDRCLVQAGAVIGTDGLGCSRDSEGVLTKFPHLGGVVMGNDIEVGANCQIAKGSFSDTVIEDGCKMNGLCFIAHNCHLEKNVWITGNTMLCGSVHVGKNTTIFSSVIIRDQRTIGEHVTIGMGSVVTKDVPSGETWLGNPAKKFEKNK